MNCLTVVGLSNRVKGYHLVRNTLSAHLQNEQLVMSQSIAIDYKLFLFERKTKTYATLPFTRLIPTVMYASQQAHGICRDVLADPKEI